MNAAFRARLNVAAWDAFPLGWRFKDPEYDPPPADALAAVAPLDAASARIVADWLRDASFHDGFPFRPGLFRHVTTVDLTGGTEAEVSESLRALGPESDESVVLSWDDETAAVTTWATVVRWWSTFFYPGSDDLTVIGPSAEWAALLHHEEVAYLGSNRAGWPQNPPSQADRTSARVAPLRRRV